MNHASGAVASPDTEVVQVGDAIWQRAERRGLVQGCGVAGACCCDTRSHVVSELVEEVWLMPET
jgi:hypothetical protein